MTEKEKIEYQAIKAQIVALQTRARELNPYAELKSISNKQFGEGWSEPYILSKVSNLSKNNGAGHDMRGKHYSNIEVKSCRMTFKDKWRYNLKHYSAKIPFVKKPLKWLARNILGYKFFSDSIKD